MSFKFLSIVVLSFVVSGFVCAEEEDEEETAAPAVSKYYDLKPSFVANFGSTNKKKLKFVKADVSIRTSSDSAVTQVMNHDALVRHQIVMLLSRQTEKKMSSSLGQEEIRVEALKVVNEALEEETGSIQIDDLLFTSFVVQR